jgi:hypothetical protein
MGYGFIKMTHFFEPWSVAEEMDILFAQNNLKM